MRKSLLSVFVVLAVLLVASVFVSCSDDPKVTYYTFTFHPGFAEGEVYTQSVVAGTETKLDPNKFTFEGFSFIGWAKSPSGEVVFSDEEPLTATSDLNLFAIWSQQYPITIKEAEWGSVVSSQSYYLESDELQFIRLEYKPDENYYLDEISLKGSKNTSAFIFIFDLMIMPDSAGEIVITPTFKYKPDVKYMKAEWDGKDVQLTEDTKPSADYTLVSTKQTKWVSGWYVVMDNVEINERITADGDVNLIICDGATLQANKGITVPEGKSLTIYGQKVQSGKLVIKDVPMGFAGIGGGSKQSGINCGTIRIKGADLEVHGGERGAGIGSGEETAPGVIEFYEGTAEIYGGWKFGAAIGGGENRDGGTITIYGGKIHAEGGNDSAGIGGGYQGSGGTITINGGSITAQGSTTDSQGGAGIGGGYQGNGGTVTINGGKVIATGEEKGAGIGSGPFGEHGGVVVINNGYVQASGSRGAAAIGGGIESDGADVTFNGGRLEAQGGHGTVNIYGDSPFVPAIGKGWHELGGGNDKNLTVDPSVRMEAEKEDEGADDWKDWHMGDERKYRMRTKP